MKTKKRCLSWLTRFMEVYARERLEEEIARLNQRVIEQDITIREQQAYISGLKHATRTRQITINNGVK